MEFLADESCDFAAVRALRSAGHDIEAVAELAPRAKDHEVLASAVRSSRVVLTEDKDFGTLCFAELAVNAGVILIRFPADCRQRLGESIVEAVSRLGEALRGSFVVLEPGRMRISRRS
jgi:predicted nuclease of predicted toxin-antitoxin system